MSQPYILRRDGRDYQAPDLETLRQWAQSGRVLPNDMVYSPQFQSWYRARDLRPLRDVLPSVTPPPAVAAPTARPPQQFWLRKGDQNYAADSLETILRWASEGNIDPDDFIYHPAYGKWFRAGDSPQLASRFPSQIDHEPAFLPAGEDPMGSPASAPSQDRAAREREALAKRQEEAARADAERADSVAKTVMDFRAADLQKMLREQGFSEEKKEPTRPGGVAVEPSVADRAQKEAERRAAASQEAPSHKREDPSPVVQAKPEPEPEAVVEREPSPEPEAVAEPTPEPEPEAEQAESVVPTREYRIAESDEPAPVEPDEDVRFHDQLGLMKLFYDVARAFVVTRDLRPGEMLETKCQLPSTGDNFLGQAKRAIYARLSQRMAEHLEGPVAEARSQMGGDEVGGYNAFVTRGRALVEILEGAEEVIGQKPPERVVIGNAARPKMSPAEEDVMLRMDAALKQLISLRVKKAAA